ncbi:MAG: class I SAM-dependent rRNA methyltransferase [Proteobacteria bacterium]|nr:class I SAM-dependent rRNA methyltransferase [Pseudomonadota bacterium]
MPDRTGATRPRVTLKPGREKSLLAHHPWVFSGALADADAAIEPGATVDLHAADGTWLARAAWSPSSQIRARAWTFAADTPIDAAFFRARIDAAVAARAPLVDADHDAVRLVHAEADGLPGVVVDRYADALVVQLLAAGPERHREAIVDALVAATGARTVVERSDAEVRALEGLPMRHGVVRGHVDGPVAMREAGLAYRVDVLGGQKTGFYLDQRDNRALVRQHARGRRVLNAFCYTGGFTLAALAGGADSVLSIDSSGPALALALANLAANPTLAASRATWAEADVFSELRVLRNRGAQFDLIVLDPPKFAPTAALASRAARAYKDINLLALKMLAPGGLLATFSCSGGIGSEFFQKVVAGAAADARVDATIVARLAATADHPVTLAFPEGEYLKGLLLRR